MQIDTFVAVAAAGAADLLRQVPDGTHGAPTPCHEWDVRALIDHIARVGAALELTGRGEPVPAELWTGAAPPFDAAAVTKAWIAPPAVARMGDMDMPGPLAGTMLAADLVLHGWDLARATGRDVTWPPEAAAATLGFLTGMAEQGRAMGLFAAPVPVPDDAPVLDRALGLSGRDPGWRRTGEG
jgi:uncharacterized protein (TIGR03086 family)